MWDFPLIPVVLGGYEIFLMSVQVCEDMIPACLGGYEICSYPCRFGRIRDFSHIPAGLRGYKILVISLQVWEDIIFSHIFPGLGGYEIFLVSLQGWEDMRFFSYPCRLGRYEVFLISLHKVSSLLSLIVPLINSIDSTPKQEKNNKIHAEQARAGLGTENGQVWGSRMGQSETQEWASPQVLRWAVMRSVTQLYERSGKFHAWKWWRQRGRQTRLGGQVWEHELGSAGFHKAL